MNAFTDFSTIKNICKNHYLVLALLLAVALLPEKANSQSFSNSGTGTKEDRYTINDDNSDNFSFLRMQVSNNKAWNMINQGYLWWGYTTSSNHSTKGTEKMRLTTNGDLTITGKLTTGGGIDVSGGDVNINEGTYFFRNSPGAVDGIGYNTEGGNHVTIFSDNTIDFTESDNNAIIMRIVGNDGHVGIGTTTPAEKLEIAGGNININEGTYFFRNSPGAVDGIGYNTEGGNHVTIFSDNTIDFTESDNDAIVMRIAGNDGHVGIGTVNPKGKLHIRGDSTDDVKLLVFSENDNHEFYYEGGFSGSGEDGNSIKLKSVWGTNPMTWRGNGHVGIGTDSPTVELDVVGTVKATSFVSSAASFPDYVFSENYTIMPLSELETYVTQHNRLPNMPSEKQIVEQGLNVPDVVIRSVENIETIYLHLIRMEKEIKALQQENATLKQQLQQGR